MCCHLPKIARAEPAGRSVSIVVSAIAVWIGRVVGSRPVKASLGEDGLIEEPWDDWRPDMGGNVIDGPFWLPSYEACRKWTNAFEMFEAVAADPLFGRLAEHEVTFLDASDFKGKAAFLPPWKRVGTTNAPFSAARCAAAGGAC